KGKPLMWRVMQELNFHTSYYREGKIKTTELYGKTLPIRIVINQLDSTFYGNQIEITVKDKSTFVLNDIDGEKEFEFNKPVKRTYGSFLVIPQHPNYENKGTILVRFNNIIDIGNSYNSRIKV